MSSAFRDCCPFAFHEEVDEPPPHKTGVLTKQGDSGRRRWVARYFVLDDRRFSYHETDTAEGPLRQAVELDPSCTAEFSLDKDDGLTMLEVTIPHADLVWRLKSPRGGLPELRAWQAAVVRAIRPRWADSMDCNVCQGRFGLLRWRHHCRRCGFCVCAACSAPVSDLLSLGYDGPTRTCDLCQRGQPAAKAGEKAGPTVTLRLGACGPGSGGAREPLLSQRRDGAGALEAAMLSASTAFSSLLPVQAGSASSGGQPAQQTHAERIRIKYGIGTPPGGPPARMPPAHAAPQQPARAAAEPAAANVCVVCLEHDAVIAALPCGHRCLCAADSQRLGVRMPCPVCREPVQQFQRIYD